MKVDHLLLLMRVGQGTAKAAGLHALVHELHVREVLLEHGSPVFRRGLFGFGLLALGETLERIAVEDALPARTVPELSAILKFSSRVS